MYIKKNQEFSTLASYGEYFQKQKELEDRLAEKYGFRKKEEIVFQNLDDPVKTTPRTKNNPVVETDYNPMARKATLSRSQMIQQAQANHAAFQGYRPQESAQVDALDQLQQEYDHRGPPQAYQLESLRSEQPPQNAGYRELFRPEMPQVPAHVQLESLHQQPQPSQATTAEM